MATTGDTAKEDDFDAKADHLDDPSFDSNASTGRRLRQNLKSLGLRNSPTIMYLYSEISSQQIEVLENSHWVLSSMWFQAAVCLTVLSNTFVMGIEADNPDLEEVWFVTENVFTAAFLVELLIKVACLRYQWFKDRGNYFDASLVLFSIIDVWIVSPLGWKDVKMKSFSLLRVLRLFRLVRLVRVFRQFPHLMLIVKGIIDAMRTTVWVGALVLACVYVCAIFTTDFIGRGRPELYPGYTKTEELIDQSEIMENFNPYVSFGTMTRSMLTLFNLLILAEWTEVVRPLYQKQPWIVLFFIMFALVITYGVMNVIIGMIVDNTMQNKRDMERASDALRANSRKAQLRHIADIVQSIDTDNDGRVDLRDIEVGLEQISMKNLLKSFDMPTGMNAEELLAMLDDDGDGCLPVDEIVRSFFRLIDHDTFQRSCLLQMGINKVKRLIRQHQQETQELQEMIRNLQLDMSQLGTEFRSSFASDRHRPLPASEVSRAASCRKVSFSEEHVEEKELPGQQDIGDASHTENKKEQGVVVPNDASEPLPEKAMGVDKGFTNIHIESAGSKGRCPCPVAELEHRIAVALEAVQQLDKVSCEAAAAICTSTILQDLPAQLENLRCDVDNQVRQSIDAVLASLHVVPVPNNGHRIAKLQETGDGEGDLEKSLAFADKPPVANVCEDRARQWGFAAL